MVECQGKRRERALTSLERVRLHVCVVRHSGHVVQLDHVGAVLNSLVTPTVGRVSCVNVRSVTWNKRPYELCR